MAAIFQNGCQMARIQIIKKKVIINLMFFVMHKI